MSKKLVMLATTRCGYCRMAKDLIQSNFPSVTEEQFKYVLLDKDDLDEETVKIVHYSRSLGVRGVPFSVLMEDDDVKYEIQGYKPNDLVSAIEQTLETSEEE